VKFLKTECKTKARAKPMAAKKGAVEGKKSRVEKGLARERISSSGGKIRCGKKK
jgi:hypothetical protein